MEQSCALCSRSLLAGVTILVSGIVPVPLSDCPALVERQRRGEWGPSRGEGSGDQAPECGPRFPHRHPSGDALKEV